MRKILEIKPLIGIGNLRLGMTRNESRVLMENDFQRNFSDKEKDFYQNSVIQLSFNDKEELEFIEISRDASIKVIFGDNGVFEIPANNLIEETSKAFVIDKSDEELGYSYIFPKIELSLWRPVLPEDEFDEDGKYFSTIGIGKEGYYKKQ